MHTFLGEWITNEEFRALVPRNVFYKQLERPILDCSKHRNRHILFRKKFVLDGSVSSAKIYISADDYYKLYINGSFAGQGPAPAYNFRYNYNVIDITRFLCEGENTIAVHTLYQGLVNRVWQSGDMRHGLILDVVADGKTVVKSDESFKAALHTGYSEMGICGYDTQFLEEYNSNADEVHFEKTSFDDSSWGNAVVRENADYKLYEQKSKSLVFEKIMPEIFENRNNTYFCDFGSNYVGYLDIRAKGKKGDVIIIRCGQELDENGKVRFNLRANCKYEERWILADGESVLCQFDYKSFRYAEITIPCGSEITDISMNVRHYPFSLDTNIKKEYENDCNLKRIWDLCVNTQRYGVQEVIQDCMEREKGFYVGDGCYTALTNMVLTGDDSMVRKLIDDAFSTDFITEGLVTCLDCSFMQEIAEYPLMLIYLVMWHYRLTGDIEYLEKNYPKCRKVLESYRRDYEKDGLLGNLDKWCVVEWPKNFQDNYDVDIAEGKVCTEPHVVMNAYYIEAIRIVNAMAKTLSKPCYRDEKELVDAFIGAFYDKERHLFKDGVNTSHVSLIGNIAVFGLKLCPDEECLDNVLCMIEKRKISSVSLFGAFLMLEGLVRYGKTDKIKPAMLDEGAWLRMLSEDATTTFEGWGKDTKWNTSLFHLTMSYGALFISDTDLSGLFD